MVFAKGTNRTYSKPHISVTRSKSFTGTFQIMRKNDKVNFVLSNFIFLSEHSLKLLRYFANGHYIHLLLMNGTLLVRLIKKRNLISDFNVNFVQSHRRSFLPFYCTYTEIEGTHSTQNGIKKHFPNNANNGLRCY